WLLTAMVAAAIVIFKYEGSRKGTNERRYNQQETVGSLYKDEAWKTCAKIIHPAWLLAYRLVAFGVLLALLIADVVTRGGDIFLFYTQWTFALITLFFGLGSSFSIYGCCQYHNKVDGERVDRVGFDTEQGTYLAPSIAENGSVPNMSTNLNNHEEPHVREAAGVWGYAFQIGAGAAVLTDCVFWGIIYPFLTAVDYRLSFLMAAMHSFNAFFLLGELILNGLRFPFFRIAYFILWTCMFVIFQWIIHACVSMRWPYAFLELSDPYAPVCHFMGKVLVAWVVSSPMLCGLQFDS
ncbi:hypothetical protein RJ639_000335, partial [Escallonia herrerae]